MEPTGDFWGGVGTGIANSPGWMVVGAVTLIVLVIGTLYVIAKYIYPGHKEIKMRELDIEQMKAENSRAQVESNRALAEQTRGTGAKVDALVIQNAELAAGMSESKARSRAMGDAVTHAKENSDHIRETTDDTHDMVREIHAVVVPRKYEGTE